MSKFIDRATPVIRHLGCVILSSFVLRHSSLCHMGKNSRDRIVDACLSEILGGQRPPDLSDRILRSLKQGPRPRRGGRMVALFPAASVLIGVFGALSARFLRTRGQPDVAGATGQSEKDSAVAKNDAKNDATNDAAVAKAGPEVVDPIAADRSHGPPA